MGGDNSWWLLAIRLPQLLFGLSREMVPSPPGRPTATLVDVSPAARADDIDPLYEPTWVIFIYSAWAGLTWFVTARVGLVALVLLTVLLAAVALAKPHPPTPRAFAADFSAILLFCAMSLSAGVLFLEAMSAPSEVLLAIALFGCAGAILFELRRRELRDSQRAQAA